MNEDMTYQLDYEGANGLISTEFSAPSFIDAVKWLEDEFSEELGGLPVDVSKLSVGYEDFGMWEYAFVWNNLECIVRMNNFYCRCGYVVLPRGHRGYGVQYDTLNEWLYDADESFIPNGGLTYSGEFGECGDGWMVGFDCMHCWDLPDADAARIALDNEELDDIGRNRALNAIYEAESADGDFKRHTWTLCEVIQECQSLAREFARMDG